jgi:hypothetical protein
VCDVLDLPGDAPRPDERVSVYHLVRGTAEMRPDRGGPFYCVDDGSGGLRSLSDAKG